MYRASLLVQEAPNDALEGLAKDAGFFDSQRLDPRPSATLQMDEGVATLRVESKKQLLDWLREKAGKPLFAFSTAPLADILAMHGRMVLVQERWITLHSEFAEKPWVWREPYRRRLVRLTLPGTVGVVRKHEGEDAVATEQLDASAAPLLLEPLTIDVSESQTSLFFARHAAAIRGINAVLLPPARREARGSYFDEELFKVRLDLAQSLDLLGERTDEPAAVTAWRLTSDPFLRDILQDGASLRVEAGVRGATRLRLLIPEDLPDPVAAFRARTALEPDSLPGPSWAAAVGRVLRRDLLELCSRGVTVEATSGASGDWTKREPRLARESANPDGTWQKLLALEQRLAVPKCRNRMHEVVLFSSDPPGRGPDHNLAEEMFQWSFWRWPASVPSREPVYLDPWRYATLHLLQNDFARSGPAPTPEERVGLWSERGPIHLVREAGVPVLGHPRGASHDDLEEWRYLMPVGTIFRTHSTIRLNDPTTALEDGYVLG